MKELDKFFNPKSIAIVGATPKKGKLGNILIENIKKGGWKGKLYFVNPSHSKAKKEYFADLNEIGKPVDLAVVAIPAKFVNKIIEYGAKARPLVRNFVVISSGFKETDQAGKKLEDNLVNLAKIYDLNILGPNCLGFINTAKHLNATFTSSKTKKGRIAIISQSGALAVAILDWAEAANIGFSYVISIGNKCVLDEIEILKFLEKDNSTEVIAFYLEDISDGSNFISAVSEAHCCKPIVIIKAGKNRAGQAAVSSHTGSIAQDERIMSEVFHKFGIIEACSMEEFQDLVTLLGVNAPLASHEAIVITNAGGPGVLSADFIGSSKNLKLLSIPEKVKNSFKKILPPSASCHNPIDILGDADPERYEAALNVVAKMMPRHPLIVLVTPQNQTQPEKIAAILGRYRNKFSNILAIFMGGIKIQKSLKILENNGIAHFSSPERALLALDRSWEFRECRKSIFKPFQKTIKINRIANRIVNDAVNRKLAMLPWNASSKLFKSYGVELLRSISFINSNDKRIHFPCVLKTDEPKITHRWDKQAVMLNIRDRRELKSAVLKMKRITKTSKLLVQAQQSKGLELILGMKRDRSFGPIFIIGYGGTLTEIISDNVMLIPPFTSTDIRKKIKELNIYPLLTGYRGEKGYNLTEIDSILLSLQNIAIQNPDISEIDINPVIFYNDGRKSAIVDAKVFIKV